MLSWAVTLFLPPSLCLSFSLSRPEGDYVKMEPLSCGSLGEKGTWVWEGVCGGEGEAGGGLLMTEAVSFLWNLLPFWAIVCQF